MGVRDKPIASGPPWQNSFAERLIGTTRRECVYHIVVLGETHLRRILRESMLAITIRRERTGHWTRMRLRPILRRGIVCSAALRTWAFTLLKAGSID
jgi:hypothetical protein